MMTADTYDYQGHEIDDDEIKGRCNDEIDETCEEVRVGSYTFTPSRVLEAIDPIAHREWVLDYVDQRLTDEDGGNKAGFKDPDQMIFESPEEARAYRINCLGEDETEEV